MSASIWPNWSLVDNPQIRIAACRATSRPCRAPVAARVNAVRVEQGEQHVAMLDRRHGAQPVHGHVLGQHGAAGRGQRHIVQAAGSSFQRQVEMPVMHRAGHGRSPPARAARCRRRRAATGRRGPDRRARSSVRCRRAVPCPTPCPAVRVASPDSRMVEGGAPRRRRQHQAQRRQVQRVGGHAVGVQQQGREGRGADAAAFGRQEGAPWAGLGVHGGVLHRQRRSQGHVRRHRQRRIQRRQGAPARAAAAPAPPGSARTAVACSRVADPSAPDASTVSAEDTSPMPPASPPRGPLSKPACIPAQHPSRQAAEVDPRLPRRRVRHVQGGIVDRLRSSIVRSGVRSGAPPPPLGKPCSARAPSVPRMACMCSPVQGSGCGRATAPRSSAAASTREVRLRSLRRALAAGPQRRDGDAEQLAPSSATVNRPICRPAAPRLPRRARRQSGQAVPGPAANPARPAAAGLRPASTAAGASPGPHPRPTLAMPHMSASAMPALAVPALAIPALTIIDPARPGGGGMRHDPRLAPPSLALPSLALPSHGPDPAWPSPAWPSPAWPSP